MSCVQLLQKPRLSVASVPDSFATNHTKLQDFVSHELASLEDLKHGGAKPIAVKVPTEMCTSHKQPFIIFCSDCKTLICQHCTLKDHLGHNYEFTSKAAPGVRTKQLEDIQSLKSLKKEFKDAVEKICGMSLEVEAQQESASPFPSRSYTASLRPIHKHMMR